MGVVMNNWDYIAHMISLYHNHLCKVTWFEINKRGDCANNPHHIWDSRYSAQIGPQDSFCSAKSCGWNLNYDMEGGGWGI